MKLTLRRCAELGDWYVIERAEHENRRWLEHVTSGPLAGAMALRDSARISDADVEGTAEEMVAIADAIERRASISFRRCAVNATNAIGDMVEFWSPRNSIENGRVARAEADELAAIIRRELEP